MLTSCRFCAISDHIGSTWWNWEGDSLLCLFWLALTENHYAVVATCQSQSSPAPKAHTLLRDRFSSELDQNLQYDRSFLSEVKLRELSTTSTCHCEFIILSPTIVDTAQLCLQAYVYYYCSWQENWLLTCKISGVPLYVSAGPASYFSNKLSKYHSQ